MRPWEVFWAVSSYSGRQLHSCRFLAADTDANGNAMLQAKFCFQTIQKWDRRKILSYRRYGKNRKIRLLVKYCLLTRLHAAELVFLR